VRDHSGASDGLALQSQNVSRFAGCDGCSFIIPGGCSILHMILSAVGAILFACYLVYDLQLVIGAPSKDMDAQYDLSRPRGSVSCITCAGFTPDSVGSDYRLLDGTR
jgi:hypothetical protein